MGLTPNTPVSEIKIDKGVHWLLHQFAHRGFALRRPWSRAVARSTNVKLAMVVPGSGLVRAQAEQEGLDKIFPRRRFRMARASCSMCLAMNDDRLEPGGAARPPRTAISKAVGRWWPHPSGEPAMAAAAGIAGHFVDVRLLG